MCTNARTLRCQRKRGCDKNPVTASSRFCASFLSSHFLSHPLIPFIHSFPSLLPTRYPASPHLFAFLSPSSFLPFFLSLNPFGTTSPPIRLHQRTKGTLMIVISNQILPAPALTLFVAVKRFILMCLAHSGE